MRQKLFTIDGVFNISGRGIVVTGELEPDSVVFRIGSAVVLIKPDGKEIETEVSGVEMIKPIDYKNFNWNRVGIMLKNITFKEDVPIGTIVFLDISN